MLSIETAFQEYYRPLCLYAMHYLSGDVDAAEDVVQDCFVRLWQREADNDRAFLYTAVRNACIDRLRRNDPLCHEVEAQDRSFLEARLWKAIDSLPHRQREALLLCKRDGLSYRETAEKMGISEKTVEHLLSNAMKALRSHRADIYHIVLIFY